MSELAIELRAIGREILHERYIDAGVVPLTLAHAADRIEALEAAQAAARANLQEAWSAMALIRETVETLGPIGAMPAAEHLEGPTFMHEAEAIVNGIQALARAALAPEQDK